MTNGWAAYMAAKEQKDGPAKKFYLIKAYGSELRAAGLDPRELSCAEIVALLDQMNDA